MKRSREWEGHGNVLQPIVKNRITVSTFLKNSCGDKASQLKTDIEKRTLKMMFENSSNHLTMGNFSSRTQMCLTLAISEAEGQSEHISLLPKIKGQRSVTDFFQKKAPQGASRSAASHAKV